MDKKITFKIFTLFTLSFSHFAIASDNLQQGLVAYYNFESPQFLENGVFYNLITDNNIGDGVVNIGNPSVPYSETGVNGGTALKVSDQNFGLISGNNGFKPNGESFTFSSWIKVDNWPGTEGSPRI